MDKLTQNPMFKKRRNINIRVVQVDIILMAAGKRTIPKSIYEG